MSVKVLREALLEPQTSATVDAPRLREETNPKYVVESVAVQLGLKPSLMPYLWPHYVAVVRHSPLIPCIHCGAASEAEMVVDVEGPVFLINRTRAVNREVNLAYKAAREYTGGLPIEKESELMLFNGFCEACLERIGNLLPVNVKFDMPTDNEINVLRGLVAKVMRQGHVYEAIRALKKVVDQPVESIT